MYVLLSREEWEDLLGRSIGTAPGGSKTGWGTICLIQLTTLRQKESIFGTSHIFIGAIPVLMSVYWCVSLFLFKLSNKCPTNVRFWCVQRWKVSTHLGGNWLLRLSTSTSSSDSISTTGMCGKGSKSGWREKSDMDCKWMTFKGKIRPKIWKLSHYLPTTIFSSPQNILGNPSG